MKDWESFFHQPQPINELIKDALIVVDTNVLLSAYQWREVTVKEVLKTLRTLSDTDKLRIPRQVIVEFAKNRPGQITQRINDIETLISGLQEHNSLNKKVPILEGKTTYKTSEEFQQKYNESLKEYRKSLVALRDDLKDLFQNDPYLKSIKKILDKSFYVPANSKTDEELMKDAEKRFKEKLPPGYKDDPKEENSAGDYIIWYNILQLRSNVIFVSGDKKLDWVYKDKKGNPISARRELIQEFYKETGGKDFAHISPKEFITLINPSVSSEVQEDLATKAYNNNAEVSGTLVVRKPIQIYKHIISETLVKFDPMRIIFNLEEQIDEYDSEAQLIYDSLLKCKSHLQVYEIIKNVLKTQFGEVPIAISEEKFQSLADKINLIRIRMQKSKFGLEN
ncbi:PIN domain-containing protein [Neobacillus sp. NPDC058068]|uniref:PIN domain-containing protein n=1 Tax=Neobacillus sp. NPDC058068 TaxID=3346325 RepID=UPI0036D7686E